MQITREQLEARRAEYQAAIERALASANANQGALQVVEELLKLLDEPEQPEPAGS